MSTESISEALSVVPVETVGVDKAVSGVVPSTNESKASPAKDKGSDQEDTPGVDEYGRFTKPSLPTDSTFVMGVPYELLTTERAIDDHSAPIEDRI